MSAGQYVLRTAATVASDMGEGPPEAPAQLAIDPVFTVSIVDDQPVTRTGMEIVVSLDPRLAVVASLADIDDLAASTVDSDVVLLALPAHRCTPALELIATAATVGRPVITSTWDQPPTLLSAMRAGARGCITRHSPHDAVADALRVVAQGGTYLCAQLVDQLHSELRRPQRGDVTGLAPREIETLQWIAQGFTQAQIASRMGLSQATVNTYAKRIRGKLNVGNKAELTRVALALGYLDDDPCRDAA